MVGQLQLWPKLSQPYQLKLFRFVGRQSEGAVACTWSEGVGLPPATISDTGVPLRLFA